MEGSNLINHTHHNRGMALLLPETGALKVHPPLSLGQAPLLRNKEPPAPYRERRGAGGHEPIREGRGERGSQE